MYPSQTADRMNIRLPDGLRDELKVRAAMNRRSMNAEVIFHLERALASAAATTEGSLQAHTSAVAFDETALQGGPINQR